jgi:hypothetical protein
MIFQEGDNRWQSLNAQSWIYLLVSPITQFHFIRSLLWTLENGKCILLKSEVAVAVERQNMCKLQLKLLKMCKICDFHGGDYEECRLCR